LSDTEAFLVKMERHKSSFDLVLSVDALDAIIAFKTAEEETSIRRDVPDELGASSARDWCTVSRQGQRSPSVA
jgi:hypothetical protein